MNFIVGHTLERMRAVYGTVGEEVVAYRSGISLESLKWAMRFMKLFV